MAPSGSSQRLAVIAVLAILLESAFSMSATGNTAEDDDVDLSADLRLRGEYDWDSKTSGGSPRPDRDRVRIRVRIGLDYPLPRNWQVGGRLRTGEDDSQQSPHITIYDDDNPEGDADIVADRWCLAYGNGRFTAWGGRNTFSFWKQNELFWDDDVTPLGAHLTLRGGPLPDGLVLHGGAFTLPDGMQDFNGALYARQAVYDRPVAGAA